MNSSVQNLIGICQRFLDGKLAADAYVTEFDQTFHETEEALPEPAYSIFDEIAVVNDLFEPNDAIRKEEKILLDEDRLRDEVKRRVLQLTA